MFKDFSKKTVNTYGHIKMKIFYHKQNMDTQVFCFRLATSSVIQNVNNILEEHVNLNIFLYQFYLPGSLRILGWREVFKSIYINVLSNSKPLLSMHLIHS